MWIMPYNTARSRTQKLEQSNNILSKFLIWLLQQGTYQHVVSGCVFHPAGILNLEIALFASSVCIMMDWAYSLSVILCTQTWEQEWICHLVLADKEKTFTKKSRNWSFTLCCHKIISNSIYSGKGARFTKNPHSSGDVERWHIMDSPSLLPSFFTRCFSVLHKPLQLISAYHAGSVDNSLILGSLQYWPMTFDHWPLSQNNVTLYQLQIQVKQEKFSTPLPPNFLSMQNIHCIIVPQDKLHQNHQGH